jgi:hypothetical protein
MISPAGLASTPRRDIDATIDSYFWPIIIYYHVLFSISTVAPPIVPGHQLNTNATSTKQPIATYFTSFKMFIDS